MASRALISRASKIKSMFETALKATVEIKNILYQSPGHAAIGEIKGGGLNETHFKVRVVSNKFKGKDLAKRHSMVYGAVSDELDSGLRALSIIANTPEEVDINTSTKR